MNLQEFKEKFCAAFENYCAENCHGDTGKLINLQERIESIAEDNFDSAIENGIEVNEEYLQLCIDADMERLESENTFFV